MGLGDDGAVTYVQLDGHEHRPVEVQLDDGIWVPGFLEAYRQVEGVWSGLVRYSLTSAEAQRTWFEEPRIRGHSSTGEPPAPGRAGGS